MKEKVFVYCEFCGKKLIERLESGMFRFVFGKSKNDYGDASPPVDMTIHGNLSMRCIRRTCKKVNIINMLPFPEEK